MSFCEFSCIQPYLVNNLITSVECLSIDILRFIIINFVRIWIFVGISYFISQLFIIIQKFSSSNVKFLFVKNIFFWVKLRNLWRSHSVIELFICSICHCLHKCFSFSIAFNYYCYFSLHRVVCDCRIRSFDFFNCVLVSAFLTFLVLNCFELNVSVFIVLNSFDRCSIFCLQYEAKLTSFQLTAFQFLSEVEVNCDWYRVHTFFSWFFWFLNFLRSWVVVVYNLRCCIFDVYATFNVCFNSGWDIEFIVATKLEFSCIDDLRIVCVSK